MYWNLQFSKRSISSVLSKLGHDDNFAEIRIWFLFVELWSSSGLMFPNNCMANRYHHKLFMLPSRFDFDLNSLSFEVLQVLKAMKDINVAYGDKPDSISPQYFLKFPPPPLCYIFTISPYMRESSPIIIWGIITAIISQHELMSQPPVRPLPLNIRCHLFKALYTLTAWLWFFNDLMSKKLIAFNLMNNFWC